MQQIPSSNKEIGQISKKKTWQKPQLTILQAKEETWGRLDFKGRFDGSLYT